MTDPHDDRRATRAERRAAQRRPVPAPAPRSTMPRWLLPALLVGSIVLAAVIAFLLPGPTSLTGPRSTVPPATSLPSGTAATTGSSAPGSSVGASGAAGSGEPTITGAQLPDLQNPDSDAAVGLTAPEVTGRDFAGNPVTISHDGRAKAIMFIAHWCPHCQAEVPLVEAWVKAGGLPKDVDLLAVATSIDPSRPNYPPDAWLQREGWTVPTIADPTNSIARAYGLAAFPFWVFIGPDGKVRARTYGELPVATLQASMQQLVGG